MHKLVGVWGSQDIFGCWGVIWGAVGATGGGVDLKPWKADRWDWILDGPIPSKALRLDKGDVRQFRVGPGGNPIEKRFLKCLFC